MQDKQFPTAVGVKSNIALKSNGGTPPVDLRTKNYNDKEQIKLLFWAERVCDDNGNPIIDECYKGCEDCLSKINKCRRPRKTNKI